MEEMIERELPPLPKKSRLQLSTPESGVTRIFIPREGFSFRGSVIMGIIIFWMLMILIWTTLLFDLGIGWSLLSLPFWLLSIAAIAMSAREIFSHQTIDIGRNSVVIRKKRGRQTASVELRKKDISKITLVEGGYKTLAGISRKGIYPAFICKDEAFGIGERCHNEEKQWLLEILKKLVGKSERPAAT